MIIKKIRPNVPKKEKPKKHKYGAEKGVFDGHKFDSLMEMSYYKYLKRLELFGEVTGIELQPRFELQEKFKYQGKTIRTIDYVLDFKVTYADGRIEYIDIKGMETPVSTMKLKMVKYQHQDKIFRVLTKSTKHSKSGWIEHSELKKINRKNKRKKV